MSDQMPALDAVDIELSDDATSTPDDAAAVTMDDVMAEDDDAPAEGAADAPATEAAAAPVVEDAPAPEPFAFNAFKQRFEVPGVLFDPKTRAIMAQDDRALGRLKQMLSNGREWEARGRQELVQARRELQQLQSKPHEEIEHAKAYLDEWNRMMTMEPDDLLQFVQDAQRHWPQVQAKAERAYAERLYAEAQRSQDGPEPDVDVVIEDARNGAADLVQDYLQDQAWATPELRGEIEQYLQDASTMNQWVARATRDMPEHGIRKGQYVALWDDARALVERYTKPYRDAHAKYGAQQSAAAKSIQQTQTVAAQNAKVLAKATPKPMAPASKRAPAPVPQGRPAKPDIIGEAFNVWRETARAR